MTQAKSHTVRALAWFGPSESFGGSCGRDLDTQLLVLKSLSLLLLRAGLSFRWELQTKLWVCVPVVCSWFLMGKEDPAVLRDMSRGNGLFIYIVKWTLEDVPVELSVSLCHVLMRPK